MMHHPNWNTASDMKALSSCTNEGGTVLFNVIKPGAMSQDEHFVDSNGSTHGALKPHLVKFMVDRIIRPANPSFQWWVRGVGRLYKYGKQKGKHGNNACLQVQDIP